MLEGLTDGHLKNQRPIHDHRLPADIERELRKMAERNTRTLAAQILHCVKMEMERQQAQEVKHEEADSHQH
jgi:hypothetical protein